MHCRTHPLIDLWSCIFFFYEKNNYRNSKAKSEWIFIDYVILKGKASSRHPKVYINQGQVLFGQSERPENSEIQRVVVLFSTAGIWLPYWLLPSEHGCSSEAIVVHSIIFSHGKPSLPDMHACKMVPWQPSVTFSFHLCLAISSRPRSFIILSFSFSFSFPQCSLSSLKGLPTCFKQWEKRG